MMFLHVFNLHSVQLRVLSLSGHKTIAVSSIQAVRAVSEKCAATQLADTFPVDIVMRRKLRDCQMQVVKKTCIRQSYILKFCWWIQSNVLKVRVPLRGLQPH